MYIITKDTQSIQCVEEGIYRSKISEVEGVKYSKYSPEKIVDFNCTINGASLQGRVETVMRILGSRTKLPIPVNPKVGMFMFPTCSMKNSDCIILSFFHVKQYVPHGKYANIKLFDKSQLVVKTSINQFDLQMKRTSQVIAYFYRLNHLE